MRRPFALSLALGMALFAGCESRSAARTSAGSESSASASSASASSEPAASPAASASYDPEMNACCQRTCAATIAYKESDLVRQPGAAEGDLTRCAVSGVVIVVSDETPRIVHAGNQYVLCCDACARKFRVDPGRFVRS